MTESWCYSKAFTRRGRILTIRRPIFAFKNPVDPMRGPSLLAQEANAVVSKNSGIQSILPLPGAQASVCAMYIISISPMVHEVSKHHVWPV